MKPLSIPILKPLSFTSAY